MKLFSDLYWELDGETRTNAKVDALVQYFRAAPPEDAAWALALLAGRSIGRAVPSTLLRQWVSEEVGLPAWIVEESYEAVGDLAETISLLLPDVEHPVSPPLHRVILDQVIPLSKLPRDEAAIRVKEAWRVFSRRETLVWHKLLTGGFRVGVSRALVVKALAKVAGSDEAEIAHRITGDWEPSAEAYQRILSGEGLLEEVGRPYPFFLAYPLEDDPQTLGPISDWQVEWKWDGIRAQLLYRRGEALLWSRGEEALTEQFPEIVAETQSLPHDVVLDGEILPWQNGAPLPFALLQKRITRKKLTPKMIQEIPCVLLCYDILELQGRDIRTEPLWRRREILEEVLEGHAHFIPSPTVDAQSWEELREKRNEARSRLVEGLMLKARNSPYGSGRRVGPWWKWKIDPFSVDAVLISAQPGHGRRANLYTDYTFGVWSEGQLVPFAKAYSGLTDQEIAEVDRFVRENTTDRFGPVRAVRPVHVFEIAFEGIQESKRHRSGVAVRFPRILRWRHDKTPDSADSLESLKVLLRLEESSASV